MVYGDCFAGSKEQYTVIKESISTGISEIGLTISPTKEIARLNNIDLLGITNLRIRAMWHIKNPSHIFSTLNLNVTSDFYAHLIMTRTKFESFSQADQQAILELCHEEPTIITCRTVNITNPNHLDETIEAVVISINRNFNN